MISKDESIVTQVAAKIASELTIATAHNGDVAEIQSAYLSHFDFVRELLVSAHGFASNTSAEFADWNNAPAPKPSVSNVVAEFGASYESAGSSLQVKGIQHGPLPAWLVDACAKAGVTSVYDNRDTATVENRRPMFKAADGTNDAKGKPLAFWAPNPRR